MLEKKFWQNVLYVALLLLICVTVWQIATSPGHISNVTVYTLYTSNSSVYTYPVSTLPPNDYRQLIDFNNFTFTMLNFPCNDSSPLILVLVHSKPSNTKTRKTVRETWGKTTHQIKVLFMIGLTRTVEEKMRLQKENEEFGDLIQGSFLDAYRNMTYKHVMVFKYAIYHCPQAKYILKTDDDVFVNMPLMMNFLTVDLSPYGGANMLFCTLRKKSRVLRSWRSKWRVSFKEYPAKVYPPYCPGWALLYSPDVVFNLYKEAQRANYFWIDDVHITGTLVEKIRLTHLDIENLVLKDADIKNIVYNSRNFSQTFLYGPPNIQDKEIKALWEYVKIHDTPTSIIKDISVV